MMEVAKLALSAMLFILLFVLVRSLLLEIWIVKGRKARLHYKSEQKWLNRADEWLNRSEGVFRYVADMLETVRWRMQPVTFFAWSGLMLLAGLATGAIFFPGMKGVVILSTMLGMFPFLLLKMSLVTLQIKTRMEFLPAVEIFYQQYVLSGHRNLRIVLQDILHEERLMYPMKPVFDQLHRHLSTNRDLDDCLRIFNLSLGHVWAGYFANLFAVGLREGVDVADSMKDLITDMRKARRADQAERNRLLEIRIANFSPIVFLGLFLAINYRLNPEQAIHYYLLQPAGRSLILDAIMLIFLSFLMGVYLSLRRM